VADITPPALRASAASPAARADRTKCPEALYNGQSVIAIAEASRQRGVQTIMAWIDRLMAANTARAIEKRCRPEH